MADNNPSTSAPPPAAAGAEAANPKNADKNEAKRLAKMEKFLAKQQVSSSVKRTYFDRKDRGGLS